ncbi:MAG: hypothetical protein LBT42_03535 [Tannerella sp.]|jgi:hypothetical protein|nr:hypothetical protein [Tannerella sp.]
MTRETGYACRLRLPSLRGTKQSRKYTGRWIASFLAMTADAAGKRSKQAQTASCLKGRTLLHVFCLSGSHRGDTRPQAVLSLTCGYENFRTGILSQTKKSKKDGKNPQ